MEGLRTINFGETGAFSASETSCRFALTLAFRVRIVLKASLKLFCLPWPRPPVPALVPKSQVVPRVGPSLCACQRPLSPRSWPLLYGYEFPGIADGLEGYRYGDCPYVGSTWSGNFSIDVRRLLALFMFPSMTRGVEDRLAEDARVE